VGEIDKRGIESATISILVNESPTDEFKAQRRLRLGDLIASFLFLLVAEGLNKLMRQARRHNIFNGTW